MGELEEQQRSAIQRECSEVGRSLRFSRVLRILGVNVMVEMG